VHRGIVAMGATLALLGAGGLVASAEPPADGQRGLGVREEHAARIDRANPAEPWVPRQFALVSNRREHLAHADTDPIRVVVEVEPPPRPKPRVERAQARAVAVEPPPGGPSPAGPLGIPERALSAYRTAADLYGGRCSLGWEVLAAIGRAESNHANLGRLYPDGRTWEPILGPVLDGSPFAAIRDTDHGRLDGDDTWDRAVGPMQFIPGTWAWIGVDGDGDGRADPHDIDDAAAGAARYLCLSGQDLSDRALLRAAILRYNASGTYADAVLAWADAYADRVTPVEGPEPPEPSDDPTDPAPAAVETTPVPPPPSTPEPTASPTPEPTAAPTPTDEATPTPTVEPTPSPTPTEEATPTPTVEPTPTPTDEVSPTPTVAPSEEPSPTADASPSTAPAG